MKKDKALETVKTMPNEFDIDALLEKLVLIEKVEKGLRDLKEGKTFTHEQVKKKIKKWRK